MLINFITIEVTRMKKLQQLLLLSLLLVIITGCGSQVTILGDLEESKIIIDEERDFITFMVHLHNAGTIPSKELYAKFEIAHDELANQIGETIVFSNDTNTPRSFDIPKDGRYFIGETFVYEGTIDPDELVNAVTVIIFNDKEEELTRFSIEKVEESSD
jgi:hypothetical protein